MKSKRELLHDLTDQNLSANERAQARCRLAIQLETEGDYEAARGAMGELWQGINKRPLLVGLDEETKGAVLLRIGALTGWLGSAKQISGAQESAKNLITESIEIFESLQESSRVAEGQIELACCYWREGAFDNGRVWLNEALHRLSDGDIELRAKALLRKAIIEEDCKLHRDALRLHSEAGPLFQQLENHCLIGSYHNEYAIVLRNLGTAENRQDYIDQTLIEYAAAAYHFEQAGHLRYQACVENNLAFLFWKLGRFTDAHHHLDRAQILFASIKDELHGAQVDETRARVLLAEGRLIEAERIARRAARTFETGEAAYLFVEALTTHATALARLRHSVAAHAAFERAISVAEQAEDLHSAGVAALTLVEELGGDLTDDERCVVIDRAKGFLSGSRDLATVRRWAIDACDVLSVVRSHLQLPATVDWTTFSFPEGRHRYDAHFIKLAVEEAGGRVARAARLLRLKRHQLASQIKREHQDIPVATRKRSLIPGKTRASRRAKVSTRAVRILHVEDHEMVAAMTKDRLEDKEGWQVETCADGNAALARISGDTHYDLLLLDDDLPGVNGIELVRRARQLAHRSRTPIIILSASPVDAEALEAGADAFLKKPQGVSSLVETISRLLSERKERDGDT